MLQTIHERLKGPFAIVILGILAVVFVFWGVEFVSLGSSPNASGVTVNGEDLPAEDLRQTYQQQMNQLQVALGDQPMPDDLRKRVQDDVLERAIRRELIRQRADELGLRASDAQVLESLQEFEAFKVDGKFSKDAYYAALRAENLEPAQFEALQRQQLAIRLLDRGLASSSFVTRGELERAAALRNESRSLAWAVLPAAAFAGGADPDDAALEAWYQKNAARFMTAESAAVEYVELSLTDIAARVQPTEEALRGYFEENQQRFAAAERRRASHILIPAGDDDAAARKKAEALLARAKAGEDFATLARQNSADEGSAQQGGDLGWAEKSFFVGPFADAVWALQPGQVTGPVKTEFGYHVIRLEAIEAAQSRSFEESRAELEAEYRRGEAEKQFGDQQERLDTLAFESGGNLAQVATEMGLTVRRVEGFTRAGGGELGADPKLAAAVFDPEMVGGTAARTVQLGEGRVVALRVASHQPSQQRPLAEVRAEVLEAVRLDQARERAAAAAGELMKQLQSGGDWAALAAGRGVEAAGAPSTTVRAVRRSDVTVPVPVLRAAFKAPRPAGAPVYGLATLETGDTAVWAVTAAQPGSPAALPAEERQQFADRIRDELRVSDAALYVAELRANAKVKTNTKVFD